MEIKNNKLIKVTNEDIINGTIIIPGNITEIGFGAFNNCSNLQSINIPDNVTKIGKESFWNCTNLKSINLPDNITIIEDYAFLNCTNLQSINLPNNLTEIGCSTFEVCTNLQSIIIPDSVTQIRRRTFKDCTNLQSINLPDSITIIENYAFLNCTNLQSINLSNNITEIGFLAFSNCSMLQSINITNNITYIKYYEFHNCPKLDTIIVSENIVYTELNKLCEQIHNDNETKHFNINLNSSLFNIIKSISHSDLSIDSVSNYVINDLIIYNTPINLTELKNSYKKNVEYGNQIISNTYIDEIRKKELLDKIKDKLEHNNITNQKYFIYSEHQDIINTIIYNLNNSISYDYRKDLEQYIKKYIESKKTSLIMLNTIENNLNNKNILEVTNDLKKYQIKKLNNNEYMELFNFGNDLNIYPLYISTTLHNTVTNSSKDIKIHQIKQKFNELTTSNGKKIFLKNLFFKFDNDNITLNKEILEELNNSINNELTNSENEIKILNELKKLIIIYLKKLEEHIGYLENYNLDFVNLDIIDESDSLLKKNIKNERIKDFKNIINLTQEKYIQINLIINSNLIYMDKLNNLRINLLPNLITKIMTDNVIRKDLKNIQEFIEISNTLNEIINSQDNIESNIKNDNLTLDNNEKNKQFYKKL